MEYVDSVTRTAGNNSVGRFWVGAGEETTHPPAATNNNGNKQQQGRVDALMLGVPYTGPTYRTTNQT